MKLKIILLFFFISFNVAAQPGDRGYSTRRFEELTEQLKQDPDNYRLIWERIWVSGFPHTSFDMYTKSGNIEYRVSHFKNTAELVNDLNKLIDSNIVIGNFGVSEFKMLRGRVYYFSGEIDKALEDYVSALNGNTSSFTSFLNDQICISIAAYYYNLEERLTKENARQAFKYVCMIDPTGCGSNQTPDCYEREKKELLKFLNEKQQLIAYYKELVFAEYQKISQINAGYSATTDYIFNKNEFYFRTLQRINDLTEFYKKIHKYKKSKLLTEQLMKCLPPDSNGQPYKTFPIQKIWGIKSDEYSKRFFNLHYEKDYRELTWDYQDLSGLIEEVK